MRRFLFTAIAAGCAWAMVIPTRCQGDDKVPKATRRPNILFLLGDDWAWPHASCLHYPEVKTPTFDRLAREGVLFRNAHCAAPSCSPSRAAILTGQWPWRLQDGANLRGSLAAKFPVYPDLLERAGYFVGLVGKGYGPGGWADRPRNPAGPGYRSFDAFLAARPKGKPFCFWFGCHEPTGPTAQAVAYKVAWTLRKSLCRPICPITTKTLYANSLGPHVPGSNCNRRWARYCWTVARRGAGQFYGSQAKRVKCRCPRPRWNDRTRANCCCDTRSPNRVETGSASSAASRWFSGGTKQS